jgi:transcriptional regulator with XRE-family HTH domain
MGRAEFGNLIRHARQERGLSLSTLAYMISGPGQVWTGKGILQLQNGQRRVTPELCDALCTILGLDPDEAYEALGWWPKGLTRRDVQEFRRRKTEHAEWVAAGQPDRRADRRGDRRDNGNPHPLRAAS